MNAVRSIFFNFIYMFGSLFLSLILLWVFLLPLKKRIPIVGRIYGGYILWVSRHVMGLELEIRGIEHLQAQQPCLIAAKHQSAFETLTAPFMAELGYPAIILKKILSRIPFWGLYTTGLGMVPIDRSAGVDALRVMSEGCRKSIESGRSVLIFPQGTRIAPGAKAPYKAGLAKVYKDLQVPVVPMALNTGVFWGKNAFFKKTGKIIFEFLPAFPSGMPPLEMMAQLEEKLETASDKLLTEKP